MKAQQILKFTIVQPVIDFGLDLVEFDPAFFGSGWNFAPEVNGLNNNDGITSFQDVIVKASSLPEKEGYRLLFTKISLPKGTSINPEKMIEKLSDLNLADINLFWSLYREPDQKILCYLRKVYGVTFMESFRRIIVSPKGYRCWISLRWNKEDSSWIFEKNCIIEGLNVLGATAMSFQI